MLNKSKIITTIILIVEEFCRLIYLELKIEFSSGACGRASFQKQRCPPWLAWRWGINACKRPGCLSKEQTICLKGKEHKESESHQTCLKTPHNAKVWGSGREECCGGYRLRRGLLLLLLLKESISTWESGSGFATDFIGRRIKT